MTGLEIDAMLQTDPEQMNMAGGEHLTLVFRADRFTATVLPCRHVVGGRGPGVIHTQAADPWLAMVQQMWDTPLPQAEPYAQHQPDAPDDPDPDAPSRRRHPRAGCIEHPSGTWVHGVPHTCPYWVRR